MKNATTKTPHISNQSTLSAFAAALLVAFTLSTTAQAVSLTWDADTVTAGAQDGNGTWDQTNTNYWDGAANDTYDTFDSITFGSGGTGTVTLGSNVRGGGNHITFANNYTIDTNGLYIGGQGNNTIRTKANVDASIIGSGEFRMFVNSTLRTESGSTLTMDAKITENGGVENLTKTDVGTLILNGANTYTGTTFINGGTVVAGVNDVAATSGALGNGGDIDFGGGTLQYGTGVTQDYSSRIVNSTSAIIIDTNGNDVFQASQLALSNTGGLIKEGEGILRVKVQDNSVYHTGDTVINGGKLQLHNTVGTRTWQSGDIDINNGSILQFAGTQQIIVSGDTITFDSNGGGQIQMSKNTIWRNGIIATTGGAKNTVSGTYFNGQGNAANRVIYDVAVGDDSVDLEVSSNHSNGGGITKNGAGTLALTNASNTMSGGTVIINDGTLEIGGAGRLQSGTYVQTITNNGIFKYNSTNAQELSGVISGTGSLEKDNSSTLTLSADNTYQGNTSVSAGTLALSHASLNNIISNSSIIDVAGGATLDVSGLTSGFELANGQTLSGAGTVSGDMTIASGSVLSPGNSPGTLSTGSQTWNDGGSYLWEINASNDAGGTQGADPGWDWLDITGSLDLSSLTAGGFTIDIDSLTSGNIAGDAVGFDTWTKGSPGDVDYSFTIATASSGITGFDADNFTLDSSGFSNAPSWDWQIVLSGSDLVLEAYAVPEPSSTALLGLGGLALMLRRKRS